MHELSICQGLIEQLARVAREQHAGRLISVTVRIGPLSGVEPELLRSAYPQASAGTIAAGATLIIERSALRVRCRGCGAESEAQIPQLLCASCGDRDVQLLSGEELLLERVEFERAEHADPKGGD